MEPGPALLLDHVAFAYPDGASVLDDVSLSLDARDSASVIGPNGGGKTTLLRLVLGLLAPTAGTIRVFGRAPSAARARVGYMPQFLPFDPEFPVSVLDVVLMGRLEHCRWGRYSAADRAAADAALGELGIAALAGQPFAHLSGGQRQRALIARALVGDPELLLLDEPTANVDPAIQDQLYEVLSRLNRRMAILVVSHDLGFVSRRIRKIICVNRTVQVHTGTNISGAMIQDLYGTALKMVHHQHGPAEALTP